MKPRSAKAKGRNLQNFVRDKILESFPQLEPDDVQCAIMGQSGTDIKLSPLARKIVPYSIECKNQQKISIWAALEQAKSNVKDGTQPALIFKRNNSDPHVVLTLSHFLELLKKNRVDIPIE